MLRRQGQLVREGQQTTAPGWLPGFTPVLPQGQQKLTTQSPQQRAAMVCLASWFLKLPRIRFQQLHLDTVVRRNHPG